MRSLNSGNCIKLLDVHDTYRGRHLVMEYATGGSLFAYARKMKYLDEEECKELSASARIAAASTTSLRTPTHPGSASSPCAGLCFAKSFKSIVSGASSASAHT